ncbi:hypothetical protein [Thermoactinomyces mirandus]|uniref:Uncharacterized protein n=1 Tax=Thermoactinomyces mirandus TaxID=2756294 RepID=A0A7W1XTA7_9BACL|nr:hypothetical protein [Thermoactinomyces mirandus]MBA4602835.1 hypothetical protein [Thermoactinomyces mirandus]
MEKRIVGKEEIRSFVCSDCAEWIKKSDEYVDLYECEGCGTVVSEAALKELEKYHVCENGNIQFSESELLRN